MTSLFGMQEALDKRDNDKVTGGLAGLSDFMKNGLGAASAVAGGASVAGSGALAAGAAQFGPLAAAAASGFALGDKLAPTVFGSFDNGRKMETEPAGGFRPGTGNKYVDWAIHGVQDLF
jgi:hypothetical protein